MACCMICLLNYKGETMNKTDIEYLDMTWNPLAMRCTRVSAGCANCWHLRLADRMKGMGQFSDEVRAAYAGEGPPVLIESRLEEPLHRKKPTVIGLQFMGDIFHRNITASSQLAIWRVMAACPQHTFLILTKRPKQMVGFYEWLQGTENNGLINLPNVWHGVSAEDQATANARIPYILCLPRAWVSIEPMLAPVELFDVDGDIAVRMAQLNPRRQSLYPAEACDLVVLGGESGPGARSMPPVWARSVRDQCVESETPFFMKQMARGAPIPNDLMIRQLPWEIRDNV